MSRPIVHHKRNIILSALLFLCVFIFGYIRLRSDAFHTIDLAALVFLQSFRSPTMDFIMRGFTSLGDENFLILFGASVYWYGKKREGVVYITLLIFSQMVSFQTKNLFLLPRPTSSEALQLASEPTPGFPSNHAQNGLLMFSFLGWLERRLSPSFILGIGIGISRIYLGVHYLSDVLGGWALGGAFFLLTITLVAFVKEGRLEGIYDTLDKRIVFSLLYVLTIFLFGAEQEFKYKVAPLTLGVFLTLDVMNAHWHFSSLKRFAAAVLCGMMGVIGLMVGLKVLLPQMVLSDMLLYSLVGVWVASVPLLFLRLNLAE